MLFLYLYNLTTSTSGIDTIASNTFTSVPQFIPFFLVFIFLTIFLGGISRQKARTGTSDYAMWGTVASMSTFMVALLMTLGTGIISLTQLIITLVLTLVFGAWLFFDRKPSEI